MMFAKNRRMPAEQQRVRDLEMDLQLNASPPRHSHHLHYAGPLLAFFVGEPILEVQGPNISRFAAPAGTKHT